MMKRKGEKGRDRKTGHQAGVLYCSNIPEIHVEYNHNIVK
jgi:hypothetical protein